ncbi:MAG TPA: aminotransferase class V-fold PLP-dependent enzyme [Candidatus Baltobacteraceae bacterium]|jgi:selenocysteine lyase/cysteine desulfurase
MQDRSTFWEMHGTYLNTATYGLPPKPAFDATVAALDDWRTGRTSEDAWEASTERARATFARLINVDTNTVAVGATVSELIGLVAASLPDGARVLTVRDDFSSTIFPFAAHGHRDVHVDAVAWEQLLDAIDESYAIAVVSHVQAGSGDVADLPRLVAACRRNGVMLCVDGTQSCGWLPTDASEVDFYVCHAYKWLLSPRGSAFLAVRPERFAALVPLHAGWFATDDPNNNLFGLPSRLSSTSARRFDTSPAWFSWVGAAIALDVVASIGIDAIATHDMVLARRFCNAMQLPPPSSPIVFLNSGAAYDSLLGAGIRASVRAGRLRVSFHIYNSQADVDRTVAVLQSQ